MLTIGRDIAIDLRRDFYRFHEDVVDQVSTSFQQLEKAVRDSNESLLHEMGLHLSTRDRELETSSLRLLGGQQDLSQNLERMERNFHHAVQRREASVAAEIQQRLSQEQATTRALVDKVSQSQGSMHSYLKQMVRSILLALDAQPDTDFTPLFSMKR